MILFHIYIHLQIILLFNMNTIHFYVLDLEIGEILSMIFMEVNSNRIPVRLSSLKYGIWQWLVCEAVTV